MTSTRETLGNQLYHLLEAQPRIDAGQHWLDRFSVVLVVGGWIMAGFTSVTSIREKTAHTLETGIWVIMTLILVEYSIRLWVVGFDPCHKSPSTLHRLRYAFFSINALDPICIALCIDGLVTHQPEFITAGFTLRLFRIFRFSKADDVLWTILKRNLPALGTVLTLWAVLLMAGSGLMYAVENKAQPDKFDNIFQSLYYMLVTFTTTGYGDLYPITPAGKIIAAATMLISAGLLGGIPIGIVAGEFIAVRNEKYQHSQDSPSEK